MRHRPYYSRDNGAQRNVRHLMKSVILIANRAATRAAKCTSLLSILDGWPSERLLRLTSLIGVRSRMRHLGFYGDHACAALLILANREISLLAW